MRWTKEPVPEEEMQRFATALKKLHSKGVRIIGHGNDIVRFGRAIGIPDVIDGCAALQAVLGDKCRPKLGGSCSLNHLIPAFGVRGAELHTALEDAHDTVVVYKAYFNSDFDSCYVHVEPLESAGYSV